MSELIDLDALRAMRPNGPFDPPPLPDEVLVAKAIVTPTPYVWRDPKTIPRREFVYGRHYIRQFLSATVAPGGVGKSSLALVEAVAMVTGRPLLGVRVEKPARVWYWNGEDPLEEIERRVAAILLHYRIDHKILEGRLFLNGRETEIVIAEQTKSGARIATPVVEALKSALTENQIDVVVIDPFVSAHRVTENDNTMIDAIAKAFGRIAGFANSAVELIHHVRKTGGAEVTAEDGRGASALIAAARSVRVLNPMTEEEATVARVGERRKHHFRSDIGKSNLAPPSTKAVWHELISVGLGNGTDGLIDDQDYVQVVSTWKWPDALEDVSVADLHAVQKRVHTGEWRENSQSAQWVGYAIIEQLGLDPDDKADRAQATRIFKAWLSNGMFKIVELRDAKREVKNFVAVGEWATE